MQPYYSRDSADFDNSNTLRAMVSFSRDEGQTWERPTIVLSSSNETHAYSEASYAYLGGGHIVGLVRDERNDRYRQVRSTDNGKTWMDVGPVPFSYGNRAHPPSLVRVENAEGDFVVLCYYANREEKQLLVIRASAQALIEEGVSAWELDSVRQIATFTKKRSGYPSVVHFPESCRAIGMFYDEQTGQDADIVAFAMDLSPLLGCESPEDLAP